MNRSPNESPLADHGVPHVRGDEPDADVSHSWVSQFVRGKIPNPGYATLKRIQAALGAQPTADQAQAGEGG